MSLNVFSIISQLFKGFAAILLAATLLASFAFAEDTENLYQIEFVLFKQATPDLSILEFEKASNTAPPAEAYLTVFPYLAEPLSPLQRVGLDALSQLSLAGQADRLNEQGYMVLSQGAWQEQITNDTRSLPIRLSSETRPFDCPFWSWICSPAQIEGEEVNLEQKISEPTEAYLGQLVIRRSRYMHAEVHIDYYFKKTVRYRTLLEYFEKPFYDRAPISALFIPAAHTKSEGSSDTTLSSSLINVKSFTFKQSRRIKNSEIHYLDHPYLGMIISIKRIEASESL
ncbi:hypothetical protein A3742_06905 [Oleiphilus sp. HI0071]|nr:hypothetical protein A3737_09735 [Oleiphilus sp. HI0065]KZY83568.1 hypothetical protein A3742_06905 [Oleiphilus sp. HI0071]KZY97803.1 hypothetical protein A3744_01045 [Oleiphilus sp. HI0073]KZZ14473.1 hypothetical protein A3750_14470 [Oleiphilus sp. HI0079]KZZ16086.1 hypothetical protein A3751_02525 [Oleiphilus sp. HI0080]KZZ59562.1 hypothetical protein A3760_06675 [Oleiphilus sp. HI0122]KZZ63511.1 hypothetical protein A3765_07905 [Oleiphilus sp. HI0130]KZZ77675.1 hypothetical protein A37